MQEDRFLIAARPDHDRDMLKLGLLQLSASEARLRELLRGASRPPLMEQRQRIAEECTFLGQTFSAVQEMLDGKTGLRWALISGRLLQAAGDIRELLDRAEALVNGEGC